MIQKDSFDGNMSVFDVLTGRHHMIDCSESRIGNHKYRQMQPLNDIFQIVHCLFIMPDRTHDTAASFHRDIGVSFRDTLPGFQNHLFFHRISFYPCCQMRRNCILI